MSLVLKEFAGKYVVLLLFKIAYFKSFLLLKSTLGTHFEIQMASPDICGEFLCF